MSTPVAAPASTDSLGQGARPTPLEAARFYVFAGASVVLAVLLVVLTALDATR